MLLLAINAYKWIIANWKLVAIASVLAGVFTAGWCVRGYICTANNNAVAAADNKAIIDSGVKGNEKLSEVEKKNAKLRETTRDVTKNLAKNRGINGERSSCIATPDGVRGINAIRRASDSSFDK